MSSETSIEWTNASWNPTTGCDRVSPGCDHCYALTLAKRLKGMGAAHYQNDGDPSTSGPGFASTMHPDSLGWPLKRRKPTKIFVNSMSDLFHDDVTVEFIARVFAVMAVTPRHTYQILTKRHARLRSLLGGQGRVEFLLWYSQALGELLATYPGLDREPPVWPLPNVHLGVSVEDQKWADIRVPALLATPAAVRFLSMEPLLGPVDLGHMLALDEFDRGIGWVIVGGESGSGARPMHPDWVRLIRDQCQAAGVPVFFKQFGEWAPVPSGEARLTDRWVNRDGSTREVAGATSATVFAGAQVMRKVGKKAAGRTLDGRVWSEFPAAATAGAS